MESWYRAVNSVQNENFRDAILFIFFTGLRKMEAFSLAWENVDFEQRSFRISDTKNNEPLTLPMNDSVFQILERRREFANPTQWVFPSRKSGNHIINSKKVVKSISDQSGKKFMIHDLRRTFITRASKLSISNVTIKMLVNHRPSKDVTDGYIIMDVESLRKPAQEIADALLHLVKAPDTAPGTL